MDKVIASLEVIFNALQDQDRINMEVVNANFRFVSSLLLQSDFDKLHQHRLSSAMQLLDDIETRFRIMYLSNNQVYAVRELLLRIKQFI